MSIMRKIKKRWWSYSCVPWEGRVRDDGYGTLGSKMAHRVVYEREVGPIPEGYEVDHLCKRRDCVQVKHLEAVTPKENKNRSDWHKWRTEITHCPHGHEYTDENTGLTKKGDGFLRYCKTCKRERSLKERRATYPSICESRGHERIEKTGSDGRRYCVVCAQERGRKANRVRLQKAAL